MTSIFRRTAAGISALIITAGAVSCGNKDKAASEPKKGDTEITNAARAEKLSDSEFSYINTMCYVPSLDKLVVYAEGDYNETMGSSESGIYVSDAEASSFEKLPIDVSNNDYMYSMKNVSVGGDGTIAVLTTEYDYGDLELPNYDDPDFDYEAYDWDAMEEARTTKVSVAMYNIDGSELASADITDSIGIEDEFWGSIFAIDKDTYIVSDQSGSKLRMISFSADGKKKGEYKAGSDDQWINSSALASDGTIAIQTYDNNKQVLRFIDPETMSFNDTTICIDGSSINYIQNMFAGVGDTLIYVTCGEGLFGIKADGTIEEKVNWIDSGLSSNDISACVAVGEDNFIIYSYDYETSKGAFSKLSMIDPSEFANTYVISLAVLYDDYQITKAVNEFNNSRSDYRIKVVNYSQYDDYEYIEGQDMPTINNTAQDQLKKDIIAGKAPDMIMCYDRAVMDTLANKGAFADLYQYMGTNGTVSKDDIMPNLLAALETNGKLYSIAPSFNLTTYVVKSKFFNTENWTMTDLINTFHSMPEGAKIFEWGNSKENVFQSMLYSMDSFVDYEKGTCCFDSQEFIDLLNFCNEFPDEDTTYDIDWETMTQDEIDSFYHEQDYACRNDKVLISQLYLSDLREYKRQRDGKFGEDITLVGIPSNDGNGALMDVYENFAILESSPSKDACWSFISGFFTEEYQDENLSYEYPALTSVFEKHTADSMNKPSYIDENNKKVEYDDAYYLGDQEIHIDPLTQEEYDYLVNYVKSANKLRGSYSTDVSNIITEEALAFEHGEKSAEDAAKMIQNRVSILVSEQS